MDKVVHFEIPADDVERAKQFYSSIFSWQLEDYPMPGGAKYIGAITVPVDEKTRIPKEPGAINGAIVERSNNTKAPVVAISVNSVDEYVKKVEAAGGKVVMPKTDIGGQGYYAYVTDSESNVIGLWQDIK